jgi:hypothetical protein
MRLTALDKSFKALLSNNGNVQRAWLLMLIFNQGVKKILFIKKLRDE